MNIKAIPATAVNSVIKNGKVIAPFVISGIIGLAIVETVIAVRK